MIRPAETQTPLSHHEIIALGVFMIHNGTVTAIGLNFVQELHVAQKERDHQELKLTLEAIRPKDIQMPELIDAKILPSKGKYTRPPKITPGHTRKYINRRLHQDNTKPR